MTTLRWSTANTSWRSMAQRSLDPQKHTRARKEATLNVRLSLHPFFFALRDISSCFMLRGHWARNCNWKTDDVTHQYFMKLSSKKPFRITILYILFTLGQCVSDVCHSDVKISATERYTSFCGCRK